MLAWPDVFELGVQLLTSAPNLRLTDNLQVIQRSQRTVCWRPLEPGASLATSAWLRATRVLPAGTELTIASTTAWDGEAVVEADTVVFARGAFLDCERPVVPSGVRWARGSLVRVRELATDAAQPPRFAEVSGDPNPVHLDPTAARAAGLPAPVLHGLCTLAMCVSAIGDHVPGFGSAPFEMGGEFSAPVVPGDAIRLSVWSHGAADDDMSFEATARGRRAVRRGVARHGAAVRRAATLVEDADAPSVQSRVR